MITLFKIDIILADGTNVGSPNSILNLDTTNSLDQIGELTFSIPAADKLAEHIKTGVSFEVYDSKDGYLGNYSFKDKNITDDNGTAILNVQCFDALKELTYETVGFNRSYNNENVSDVINDLVTIANGWSVDITDGFDNTTIDYQGESILRAVDEQRDRNSAHFRLKRNTSRVLEFGLFGEYNDIIFTNLRGQTHVDSSNKNIGIISGIHLLEESQEIYNKIIPLGFGQGVSQLTIEQATLGEYPVLTALNADGSSYYYIKDETSSLDYRQRTRILTFPNLRPISNSDQDIINASNALKLTAEAYIKNHLEPKITYSVNLLYIPPELQVGDKVRIQYKGNIDGVQYIDIDDYFYVMDLTKNRKSNGSVSFSVNITNVDERRTTDTDVIVDVVRDLKSLNVHIPASITYSPIGPYTKRIKGNVSEDGRIDATFKARIKDEVLYLNRAMLYFETSPLKSSVTTTASAGSSTTTSAGGGDHNHIVMQMTLGSTGSKTLRECTFAYGSLSSPSIGFVDLPIDITPTGGLPHDYIVTASASGDHTHDIDIPSHTHDMLYDVFQDDIYPMNLGIIIDGIDYTADLLTQIGETIFAENNNAYEYELDITSILNLNLKQIHTIEIYANDGRGEITASIDMMVTIQPIRITA